jgi:hypothetical protein
LSDINGRGGQYAGMWKNFLSKVPMIIEFRQRVLGIYN